MYLDAGGQVVRSGAYHINRREGRYVSSVPVSVQRFLRFGPFVTRGVTLDISKRGLSALVCGAPRAGETVVIALSPRDAVVELLATVRHSSDAKTGFEFYPQSGGAEQGIQEWIDELKQDEESLFPRLYAATARYGSD
jgi:PilZ domain